MISSLAEGADRIGARVAAEFPDCRLEAPLPFPPDDYITDFETVASKEEFRRLLDTADVTPRRPDRDDEHEEEREEGYVAVGKYVAIRSDVLVAVWNGLPSRGRGGTAEIVQRAVTNEVPVFWVPSNSPARWAVLSKPAEDDNGKLQFQQPPSSTSPDSSPELRSSIQRLHDEWRMVDGYNEAAASAANAGADLNEQPLPPNLRWAGTAVGAADTLAIKYQRRYRGSLRWTFRLAALAVVAIAAAKIFDLALWFEASDAVFILALVAVVWWSRKDLQHERYLGYRFLAERLREAPFLAEAVIEQVQPTAFAPEFAGYPSEGWPWRVFDEIWSARPRCTLSRMDVRGVSTQLAELWIGTQLGFQDKTYVDARAKQQRLEQWVKWLFVATISTALFHLLLEALSWEIGHEPYTLPNVLVFVSISCGAIGAALAGFGSQRGYRRDASRARQMQIFLQDDLERMLAAKGPTVVRHVAEDTHRHMFAESRTWFGDLLFEEIEVHT
jgi:hypothetical protein